MAQVALMVFAITLMNARILAASPADEDKEWTSRTFHIAGVAADVGTTFVGLNEGGREANPFASSHPRLLVPFWSAVEVVVLDTTRLPHRKLLRYITSIEHGACAVWNAFAIRNHRQEVRRRETRGATLTYVGFTKTW